MVPRENGQIESTGEVDQSFVQQVHQTGQRTPDPKKTTGNTNLLVSFLNQVFARKWLQVWRILRSGH